jgi:hypothetical protein
VETAGCVPGVTRDSDSRHRAGHPARFLTCAKSRRSATSSSFNATWSSSPAAGRSFGRPGSGSLYRVHDHNETIHRKEEQVRIPDFNEPFPDLAVAHGDLETYADHHPGPEDVSLVIDISDTTLAKDRGVKQENYARAGIPFYWIVNLAEHQVEVYSDPQPDGYGTRIDYRSGQSVPLVLDGTTVGHVAVDDMLPRVTG